MIKVLEGQISFGGMQDALEAISRQTNIKHGLVQVTSNSCSGLMGVFCGRFITGALLTLSGETGLPALRQLLQAKDGSFAFLDVTAEPVAELNQSLGVDLQQVLASVDFSLDSVPVSEQSLVGLAARGESEDINLIDTNAGEDVAPAPQLTTERINQTYQRIASLSRHLKAKEELGEEKEEVASLPPMSAVDKPWGSVPHQPDPDVLTEDMFYDEKPDWERRRRHDAHTQPVEVGKASESMSEAMAALNPRPREEKFSNTGNYAVVYDNAPPTQPQFKSQDEYKRLKGWGSQRKIIAAVVWLLVIGGAIGAAAMYGPQLLHHAPTAKPPVKPKHK